MCSGKREKETFTYVCRQKKKKPFACLLPCTEVFFFFLFFLFALFFLLSWRRSFHFCSVRIHKKLSMYYRVSKQQPLLSAGSAAVRWPQRKKEENKNKEEDLHFFLHPHHLPSSAPLLPPKSLFFVSSPFPVCCCPPKRKKAKASACVEGRNVGKGRQPKSAKKGDCLLAHSLWLSASCC